MEYSLFCVSIETTQMKVDFPDNFLYLVKNELLSAHKLGQVHVILDVECVAKSLTCFLSYILLSIHFAFFSSSVLIRPTVGFSKCAVAMGKNIFP